MRLVGRPSLLASYRSMSQRSNIVAICEFLKADSKNPFDYLSDLTCVHYPDKDIAPFEVVYNLLFDLSKRTRAVESSERVKLSKV